MDSRLKEILLLIVLSLGMALSAEARIIFRPEHDHTISVSQFTFGIRSWKSYSIIYYGPSYFRVPLSFWPTVSLFFLLPLAAGGGGVLASRARQEKFSAGE